MIEPLLIQSFRNSRAIEVVSDRRSEIRPDFLLQSRITAFQAVPRDGGAARRAGRDGGDPAGDAPGRWSAPPSPAARSPPRRASSQAIAAAFDEALGKVFKRLVEWTLTTGQAAVEGS